MAQEKLITLNRLTDFWGKSKEYIDNVSSNLNTHINDTIKHITSSERTNWNNKTDVYIQPGEPAASAVNGSFWIDTDDTPTSFIPGGIIPASSVSGLTDIIYPVGSVYISSTNTDPSTLFGGTWQLIDKEFKYFYGTNVANAVTINEANCTAVNSVAVTREGHTLEINVSFTNAVAITDSTIEMFTFNFDYLGIDRFSYSRNFTWFSDVGQALITANIAYSTGSFTTRDVLVRGSSDASLKAGTQLSANQMITVTNYQRMLDSACDKFYFKRTA